jgi:hypothetical protein
VRTLLALLLIALSSAIAAAQAQPIQPEIYWRVVVEPRPGGEAVVAFFLGTLRGGEPSPLPDASYSARALIGGRSVELPVTVSGGIAYAKVPVPLEDILGGSIALNLSASSESYFVRSSRQVALSYGPDHTAMAVLALALAPSVIAVAIALRGRRW